jgi:NADH dehydrogenase
MRVAIFGGTGFVGSYLIDAMVEAGITPVVLVRPGHEHRLRHPDQCRVVSGDIGDQTAIASAIDGADVIIYNIGILREAPGRDITFGELQDRAARRVIDNARRAGVQRFLLMSANGVDAETTEYQITKRRAEIHLEASGLDWTIFRPSVVFGDPRGRMEFATQLKQDIIESLIPAPLFFDGFDPRRAGTFEMSPVHVHDVADAFVAALRTPSTIGQTLHLGGPEPVSWQAILKTIAAASGKKRPMIPVPAIGVRMAATLLDRWERFPVTGEQIQMLLQGNVCPPDDLVRLGIEPTPFSVDSLQYLATSADNPHSHPDAA